MPFTIHALPDYDQLVYELLHETIDHLIDLGARCNAHSDVLEAEPEDPDDEQPHPLRVLKAQLQLDGAEEELALTQQLVQITSNLLIARHARRVVHHAPPPPDHSHNPGPGPGEPDSGPEDGSDLPDQGGGVTLDRGA